MATIKISELRPAGSELFQDSESFLNELTDREMGNLSGGIKGLTLGVTGASKITAQSKSSVGLTLSKL